MRVINTQAFAARQTGFLCGGGFPEYKSFPDPDEKVDEEKSLQTLLRGVVGVASHDDLLVIGVTLFDDGDSLIISTIIRRHKNFLTFDARGDHVLSVGRVWVNVNIMRILLVRVQCRNVCVHSCIPFLQIEFKVCSIFKYGGHHLEVRYGGLHIANSTHQNFILQSHIVCIAINFSMKE